MKNRILGIEKSERLLNNLAKFLPIKMDVLNIPSENRDFLLSDESVNFFTSTQISEQINELEKIKNNYDLCIVSSWDAAKLAFFCNMKYIFYFIGNDIRYPTFSENINVNNIPNLKLNQKQPLTYQNLFDSAVVCVTGSQELFTLLKKQRSDSIRIDRTIITPNLYDDVKPLNIIKKKFTFFSPTRIGSEKGTNLLWEAVKLCKTDFDILQINWLDITTSKIKKESEKLLKIKPSNVYLINKIKHEEMGNYYHFSDCVLGEMMTGHTNSIEREASLCHKPVLNYNSPDTRSLLDGIEISTPFLPRSNDPKEIAKIIDLVVSNKEFRNSLANKEFIFMKNLTDPIKTCLEWESLIKTTLSKKD